MNDEASVDYQLAYGLAAQVDRASGHMGLCHQTATVELADANFGKILELITSDYAALLPTFHHVLDESGQRLGLFGTAIEQSLQAYQDADDAVASRLGEGGIPPSTAATGFEDPYAVTLVCSQVTTDLPEVSFGYIFDKVCDLIVWVGFRDPREYVTQWIAGDVGKAYTQGEAWNVLGDALQGVSGNLDSGANALPGAWTGQTADAIGDRLREWSALLAEHSGAAASMAGHVLDMADQAVAMAQVVVDIIKTVISLCSAALSSAYIPGYGQWKAIKTVKEAWELVNNARKVITTFWNAVKMVISWIRAFIQSFSITALPPAPQVAP